MKTDYKFKTWETKLYEIHAGDVSEAMRFWMEPDLALFIDHHASEVEKAKQSASWDIRWSELEAAVIRARKSLDGGSQSSIGASLYHLGFCAAEVSDLSHTDKLAGLHARLEKSEKERPLMLRNFRLQTLKAFAQDLAQTHWCEDAAHKIRLAEMCNNIYREVAEFADRMGCFELMPEGEVGLKPWLRPVAPDYARKGGPPRK